MLPIQQKNCFIKARFLEHVISSETVEVNSIKEATRKWELNPDEWESVQKVCNTHILFEEFLNVDNELETWNDIITGEEIVSSIDVEIINGEIGDLRRTTRAWKNCSVRSREGNWPATVITWIK